MGENFDHKERVKIEERVDPLAKSMQLYWDKRFDSWQWQLFFVMVPQRFGTNSSKAANKLVNIL